MMCLKPITLQNKSSLYKSVHSIQVPCGKCLECLQQYQNNWFVRFYFESLSHSKCVFFTLTYAPDKVPTLVDANGEVYLTVYKKHVQDWLKRIRHVISQSFKYFITSEYGPRTNRPHLHGVFFGLNQKDIHNALYDWQVKFGFTQSRDINILDKADVTNSLRYIAKYCNKVDYENPHVNKRKVFPTFHLISKGLGEVFVDDFKDYILNRHGYKGDEFYHQLFERNRIDINGYKYSLPRYYKTKIYGEKSLLSSKYADYVARRNDELYNQRISQIQAENLTDSAFRILDMQDRHADSAKISKLAQRQVKFYNNSKL